jgi:TIR domain
VRCGAAALFFSKRNMGPWQVQEVRAAIILLQKRNRPVIPVLLPSATRVPELPLFLAGMTWVDFRKDQKRALAQLVWGITGRRPSSLDA